MHPRPGANLCASVFWGVRTSWKEELDPFLEQKDLKLKQRTASPDSPVTSVLTRSSWPEGSGLLLAPLSLVSSVTHPGCVTLADLQNLLGCRSGVGLRSGRVSTGPFCSGAQGQLQLFCTCCLTPSLISCTPKEGEAAKCFSFKLLEGAPSICFTSQLPHFMAV